MSRDNEGAAVEGAVSPVGRKLVGIGVGVAVAIVGWYIGAAVIPRWWAQRVGGVVDGRLTVGALAGLFMGVVFTLVPLLVLWMGFRFRKTWQRAVGFLIAAAVTAAPNLFLLGIVMGNGNAAHAGERILDVDGPGYRGGSLIGAVLGALAFVAVLYLSTSRRRNKNRARDLKGELREREAAEREAAKREAERRAAEERDVEGR